MIIDRIVVREVLKPLITACAILIAIFLAVQSGTFLGDAVNGVLPANVVAILVLLNTIIALEVLLPTALYLSVIMGLGRLHRDLEITALGACGVGEPRILRTVFWLSAGIAVLVAALSLFGRPWAYQMTYQLEAQAVANLDVDKLEARRFQLIPQTNQVLFAERIDRKQGVLYNVFLQQDAGDRSKIVFAREARLISSNDKSRQSVVMSDGYAYELDRVGQNDTTIHFNRSTHHLNSADAWEKRYRRKAEPTLKLAMSPRLKDIAEFQWRLSTPLATMLLGLLAVPLSRMAPRRGGVSRLLVAVVLYATFFNLAAVAKTWLEQGRVSPFPGIWWAYLPPAILLFVLLALPAWRLRTGRAAPPLPVVD